MHLGAHLLAGRTYGSWALRLYDDTQSARQRRDQSDVVAVQNACQQGSETGADHLARIDVASGILMGQSRNCFYICNGHIGLFYKNRESPCSNTILIWNI